MTFNNPITGQGGSLIIASLHSPNYVPGVSGWTLNSDGSAELTGLSVGGSISDLTDGTLNAVGTIGSGQLRTAATGARTVIDSAGIRLYNSGGGQVVNLDATTGNATFAGTLSGASGSFSGSVSGSSITGSTVSGGLVTGATVQTSGSGQRVTLNPSGSIDLVGSLGHTGTVLVNAFGEIAITAGGGSVRVGGAQCTITTPLSAGSISGSSFFTAGNGTFGSLNCSSSSLSGSFSGTHSGSWSGSISPSSVSTGSLSASGGSWTGAVSVGSNGKQTSIQGSSVLFGNIPFTSGTTPVAKFNGRFIEGVSSSRATKVDIQDAAISVEDVLALRPVTYYALDQVERAGGTTDGVPLNFGFIAEEVDEIPAARPLVIYGDDGWPLSLGYERFPAVQQIVLRAHQTEITELRAMVLAMAERIESLEAQLREGSA